MMSCQAASWQEVDSNAAYLVCTHIDAIYCYIGHRTEQTSSRRAQGRNVSETSPRDKQQRQAAVECCGLCTGTGTGASASVGASTKYCCTMPQPQRETAPPVTQPKRRPGWAGLRARAPLAGRAWPPKPPATPSPPAAPICAHRHRRASTAHLTSGSWPVASMSREALLALALAPPPGPSCWRRNGACPALVGRPGALALRRCPPSLAHPWRPSPLPPPCGRVA